MSVRRILFLLLSIGFFDVGISFLSSQCIGDNMLSSMHHVGYGASLRRGISMRAKKKVNDATGATLGKSMTPKYSPKSENQYKYTDCLKNPNMKIVIGVGAAGTGKTLFACCEAVSQLKTGAVQKIIMTRPVVPVEEEIGFLPGSLVHKMDPWTRPIFDILLEFYSQKDIDAMVHGGVIEISPLGFMRGRTFKRAFIIADEMQNSSPNQMLMLATRIGDDSKMVITGDLKQSDRGRDNGLGDLLGKVKAAGMASSNFTRGIGYVEFGVRDIQRSPIVSDVLRIYEGDFSAANVSANVVVPSSTRLINVTSVVNSTAMADAVVAENRVKIQNAIKKMARDYSTRRDNDAAMIPAEEISKKFVAP
jgi:phosphate starvation-inducible protein PhoH and related proteins